MKHVIQVIEVPAKIYVAEKGILQDITLFQVIVNDVQGDRLYENMGDIPFAKLMGAKEPRRVRQPRAVNGIVPDSMNLQTGELTLSGKSDEE